MEYIAKKDFSYRTNNWKKGDSVKAFSSLIQKWLDNGNIELKKEVKKPKEKAEK